MATMEDFEICAYVARRRAGSIGEGDLVRVVHRGTGATLAMKRVEVDPSHGHAEKIFRDLTRSACLKPHSSWISLRADLSFIQNYRDSSNCQRTRVCIVEELADHNLESEIITRGVDNQPFEDIFATFAELVHGVQALHAQDCFHRDISPQNIFFTGGRIRLGPPGPEGAPPAAGYYPHGACEAYSADIFALGLVLLEMVTLHPLTDMAATGALVLDEIVALDGSAATFRSWLDERCSLLALDIVRDNLAELLAALFSSPAAARPTTDDLLELQPLMPYADPLQILPITSRPCVVMAHRMVGFSREVPRRFLLALPSFHELFSKEGGEQARCDGNYNWCGHKYDLWWLEQHSSLLRYAREDRHGVGVADSDTEETVPPPVTTEVASLVASAALYRSTNRLAAADVYYRAALRIALHNNPPALSIMGTVRVPVDLCWQGLAATLLERGNFPAAYSSFQAARSCGLGQRAICALATPRRDEAGSADQPHLWGLCDFFVAVESLRERSMVGSQREGGLRAAHVALYYRSAVAAEAGDWEVFAALGEFYRLVGCPELPFREPAPDISTALSYFEQARGIQPAAPFVEDRLAWLSSCA
eukprot:TRINITY_DN55344_c0_g1_i1.p1 TRINITY_DN55344_c0_g1~~TRINITY_DN55344_c0_g1_i1.p1  ORF type:complete len:593 (+),score=56.92 TRINITY_DN55344_c0_g1_i1:65-1843(+)